MRFSLFFIGFVLLIILVSGCTQVQDKKTPSDKVISKTFNFPGILRATVSVSNTAPAINESVSFSYNVIYEGKPVKVVIVQKRSWPDTFGNQVKQRVVELQNGSTSVGFSTILFTQEGEYTYELGIFDCREVEAKLKTPCEDADSEDIFNSITPVKLAKRTVNVKGAIETIEDCGESQICLSEKLENCTPTTATIKLFEETKITIQGIENDNCKVHYLTIRSPNPALEGLNYTCLIPVDRLSDFEQFLAESLSTACTGPYWDYLANPPEDVDENPEDFLSELSCENDRDCLYTGYPECFLDSFCAKPNQFLSDYIHQNYELENCSDIPCENCEKGTLVGATLIKGSYDFDETFCIECTSGNIFTCNEGYECNLGRCVEA